jgi:hypothetical protein
MGHLQGHEGGVQGGVGLPLPAQADHEPRAQVQRRSGGGGVTLLVRGPAAGEEVRVRVGGVLGVVWVLRVLCVLCVLCVLGMSILWLVG